MNNLLCFTGSCVITLLKKAVINWLIHLGFNLETLISFHQTLTNVLPALHRVIKAVQTLLVVTLVHAYLGLDWTVMGKLAMVRETKTIRLRFIAVVTALFLRCPIHQRMRFPTHYVLVTKRLPDIKNKENPNQTVLNKVRILKGTPCDPMWRLCKVAWIWLGKSVGLMENEVFGSFNLVSEMFCIRNRDFRKHLLHPFQTGLERGALN